MPNPWDRRKLEATLASFKDAVGFVLECTRCGQSARIRMATAKRLAPGAAATLGDLLKRLRCQKCGAYNPLPFEMDDLRSAAEIAADPDWVWRSGIKFPEVLPHEPKSDPDA